MGVGSTAQVYAGFDPLNGRNVAIKVLHGNGDKSKPRAVREAQAMSMLRHENIVGVIGLVQVTSAALPDSFYPGIMYCICPVTQ